MRRVSTDDVVDLAQIDLYTNEVRWLIGGADPFATTADVAIARVVTRGMRDRLAIAPGSQADTTLWVRVPTLDLNSTQIPSIEVITYVGTEVVLSLWSDDDLDDDTLYALVERIAVRLTDLGYGTPQFTRLGLSLRDVGVDLIKRRTRMIEQNVRDALAGAKPDYDALRAFPGQLAAVERVADTLSQRTPRVQCDRQDEPILDGGPRSYSASVEEAARDARDASSRLSGLLFSQQLVLTERQGVEARRFEHVATTIGAGVLVPGLVAAVFGANVGFRGRDSSADLYALLLFMVAGGTATYAVLWALQLGAWRAVVARLPGSGGAKARRRWLVLALLVLASALGVAGAAVMSGAPQNPTATTKNTAVCG